MISHFSVVAAILLLLCHETKGGTGQFIQTPNTHESLDLKATDASSNYMAVYESIFCPPLNPPPPPTQTPPNTHTHTPHTLRYSSCPPEHNAGHDWDMTPLPPHGESNKHHCCVKNGGEGKGDSAFNSLYQYIQIHEKDHKINNEIFFCCHSGI